MPSVPLRCACGAVRGELLDAEPARVNHVACYCRDCQAYAAFLGREGVLDALGGTTIVQTTPSRLRISAGREQLRSMRLSEGGLLRWYAGCCRTPIANMFNSPRSPFVGVPMVAVDADEPAKVAAFGPLLGHVNTTSAVGGHPAGLPKVPWAPMGRGLMLVLRSVLTGGHAPSAFREADGWISPPQVLSPEERAALAR
jgi:hypothetical protein